MFTNLKSKLVTAAIVLNTLILLMEIAPAQEQGYPALDLMLDAGRSYRAGLAPPDAKAIQIAGDAYLDIRQTLLNDPNGLARQYQKLIPKTAYMLGWCHLRRAEILGEQDQMDLALVYFDSVATDAVDFLGGFAAIMMGDILLRQAVEEKYRLLCEGGLDSTEVERLTQQIDEARTNFTDARGLLPEEVDQQALIFIKSESVLYELARLHSSVGDSAMALVYLDSINYSSQTLSVIDKPGLTDLGRYFDAVTTFEKFLLAPANATVKADVSSLGSRFNQFDRSYRTAVVGRMNGMYTAPIDNFGIASRLNARSGDLPIPEANYFRGFTHLGLATNEDTLRGINSTPARVLGFAKEDFDRYVGAVGALEFDADERLQYLLSRAEHRSLVLGFALGETLSDQELMSMSSDDVEFLIRIAASTHTQPRRRCIDALHRFFDAYMPRLEAGTLDDRQNNPRGEGCSTVGGVRFTRDQALFYKGILQALEAEGQQGREADRAFETAATTMAQVSGDLAAEATYVRARSLCRARKYAEAEPLLRHLVGTYGSVRALYWYAMAYRGIHPLQDVADSTATAIKDELHGLMLAVREAIRDAGDQPQYDNLRINAQDMLTTSLSGHFRNPDNLSIGGLDQLNCPETLSVDLSGLTPELVMYETLSEKAAIGEQFAEEGREDLIAYGFPKLWLAPGVQYFGNSAIPTIGNSFAPAPDSVHIEYNWRGRIQFVDASANNLILDDCHVELVKNAVTIDCVDSTSSHNAYFFDADIDIHDSVLIRATKRSFYLTTTKRTYHEPGDAFFTETLARQVSYDGPTTSGEGPFNLTQNSEDTYSYNVAANPKAETLPASLVAHFTRDRSLRDYANDQTNGRFLAVSSDLSNGIIIYTAEGSVDTMTLVLSASLNSAEGITVDRDGNTYVADWGNHRVIVLDASGRERFSFGAQGQNQTANSGEAARFMFPNRIVVEEDLHGSDHPRQRHILVTDWFGVHKFDARGSYLDSPVNLGLAAGSAYEITLDGYGPGSELRVYNLTPDQPHLYTGQR